MRIKLSRVAGGVLEIHQLQSQELTGKRGLKSSLVVKSKDLIQERNVLI
jgi:hypothetical protein